MTTPWLTPEAAHVDVPAALAHFRAHGWARLGRVLSDEGLAALGARLTQLMLGEVRHEGLFFQMDAATGRYEDAPLGLGWQGPSLAYRKLEKLEKDPLFLAWLQNPLFARVARAYLPPGEDVVLYRAIVFNKGPAGGSNLPWHQDGGKMWGLTAEPELQLWTALDDAPPEAGCLEVVPGSHRAGLATPVGGVVPPDRVAAADADARAVAVPARAGEVLLVHNHVWHRSGRNATGRARRAFSVSLMPASVRCTRTRRAPRTFLRVFPAAPEGGGGGA